MTYIVKVNTAHGPVIGFARGEQELDALLDTLYADGPLPTYLTVAK
jgi:hypothetical protein